MAHLLLRVENGNSRDWAVGRMCGKELISNKMPNNDR